MTQAGIYEERFDIQIEQTAENMVEIDELKSVIKNEHRVITEVTTTGNIKHIAHPLFVPLQNAQALLVRQLGALGLNKTQEKKTEARNVKSAEPDGVQSFFGQK